MDERHGVACEILEVLAEAAAAAEPSQGTFDDPTSGDHLEAMGLVRPLDDLDRKLRQDAHQRPPELRPLVAAVGEQLAQEREQAEQGRQDQHAAVAVLNVRRMNDGMQQQAYRIDEDMPLLALDLLARIVPVRIDAGPPFSALFTLWLSITQAVGLASRPICSRHLTYRAWWIVRSVPS